MKGTYGAGVYLPTRMGPAPSSYTARTPFVQLESQRYRRGNSNALPVDAILQIVHPPQADSPFMIAYKPAGLCVQNRNPWADSVHRRIQYHSQGRCIPYFPHRLDRDTQGLLCFALNPRICANICKSMVAHAAIKKYRVLVDVPPCRVLSIPSHPHVEAHLTSPCGTKLLTEGWIHSFHCRKPPVPKPTELPTMTTSQTPSFHIPIDAKFANQNPELIPYFQNQVTFQSVPEDYDGGKARKASTFFRLLAYSPLNHVAMYEATLLTGRTHQLRIHFADAGFPIVNDIHYNRYGVRQSQSAHWDEIHVPHTQDSGPMGLQAFSIELPDPIDETSSAIAMDAPIPPSWQAYFMNETVAQTHVRT